jgi:hypothetical protein
VHHCLSFASVPLRVVQHSVVSSTPTSRPFTVRPTVHCRVLPSGQTARGCRARGDMVVTVLGVGGWEFGSCDCGTVVAVLLAARARAVRKRYENLYIHSYISTPSLSYRGEMRA